MCVCEQWYGAGLGLNAFVSITRTPIDYDHFPSITLYQKRGGKLKKKNGKMVERGEGKISIIKMELVSELQKRITFLPFHSSDCSGLLSHIYHM